MADFSTTYGRPWQAGGANGQHDEEGIVIYTIEGLRVCKSPSIYDVAQALQLSHHAPTVWQAYHDLAHLIVDDHNSALERENTRVRDE